jgi:GPH family glycoside/pentoside/hexuronide:cation symporter
MEKVSRTEKFGYGLGDTASNIVFQVVINFMIYFYTDVFGMAAATAGTMMLAVRIFDAVTDPVMGAVADRARSRWGRYRPWLLWGCIPYGVLAVLTFTTPNLPDSLKLIYAFITYALLMVAYTAINIPYSALGGVITNDPQERASIQSWRFGLAMVGGAIVAAGTLPLVKMLGGDNKQLGFTLAMVVLSIFAILCFIACFKLTRERVQPSENKSQDVKGDVLAMVKNSQWWIIAIVTFLSLVGVVMRSGATPYYVEYYLNRPDLITTFVTGSMLAGVAGAAVAGFAVTRICKVTVMKFGVVGILMFHAALFFVPADATMLALTVSCLANFAHMIFIPMVFSAVPDTVDYGQKKMGKGGMAMSYSGHLLALKFGVAIGGALIGWMLGWHGYVSGQAQTEMALEGIVRIYAGGATAASILMLAVLAFYKLKQGWNHAPSFASP